MAINLVWHQPRYCRAAADFTCPFHRIACHKPAIGIHHSKCNGVDRPEPHPSFWLVSISAGMWRLSGVNTYLLFKQPAKALSLTEFWSKRWNIAFSEMTSVAIFRPLKNKVGSAAALMTAFIFSGLLHEIALSVPVNSGYGLPTLYFIIQGSIVLLEKAVD